MPSRVPHGPGRDRQRHPGERVGAHPHPDVVELLAARGTAGRHLLRGQGRGAVLGEHVADLAGLTLVTVGEGQRHEVAVPPVHRLVVSRRVDEEQPDVDGVVDRLGHQPLEVDRRLRGRQPLPRLLAVGDVHDLGDEVERDAVVVAQQRDRDVTPHHAAIGVQVALEQAVRRPVARQRLLEVLEVELEVVGVRDLVEGQRHERLGVVPEHVAQRLVDRQQLTVRRDQAHADRR